MHKLYFQIKTSDNHYVKMPKYAKLKEAVI